MTYSGAPSLGAPPKTGGPTHLIEGILKTTLHATFVGATSTVLLSVFSLTWPPCRILSVVRMTTRLDQTLLIMSPMKVMNMWRMRRISPNLFLILISVSFFLLHSLFFLLFSEMTSRSKKKSKSIHPSEPEPMDCDTQPGGEHSKFQLYTFTEEPPTTYRAQEMGVKDLIESDQVLIS